MEISRIWSHPVKSMVGQRVESARLTMLGIEGDRHWAVRDLDRGGIRGAKRIGGLMRLTAERTGDAVRIGFPDGSSVSSDDGDVDSRLSGFLGVNVRLESLPDSGDLEHFRRGPAYSDDPMEELRSVFGREPDEPLPNFAAFPPDIAEFESPPGTHHDCWPLMVMTESAFDALRGALPDSVIDDRRFRPSFVVAGADPGHPEFNWKGRTARVGTALLEFLDPCPRCVMVTREIDAAVPEDRRILRHIVRDLGQNLGVYARVVEPGDIRTGSDFELD